MPTKIPELKIKKQKLDNYLSNECIIISHYAIITIENLSADLNNPAPPHKIQLDGINLIFSQVFAEYFKNIQHQNSQMIFSH